MAQTTIPTELLPAISADRMAKTSPTYGAPGILEVGIGDQTADASATSLTRSFPIKDYEVVDDLDAVTGWSATTDGSVALNTTAGEFIEGTGCLNLVKSGSTQTSVTYSKTVTSVDFTSKELWVWLHVGDLSDLVASGTAVELRFGSDASNYYYIQYAASALSTGANWLYFNSSTATGTTGSPSIAACDYVAIILTVDLAADTFTGNSIRLDHMHLASAGDYQASFETGPTIVGADNRTIRSVVRLRTNQAIGATATNTGWKTTDGTLYGIDQFTLDTKTQSEEWQLSDDIQYVEKTLT